MTYYSENIYVCKHEDKGCCLGNLATIFLWQHENDVTALDCIYYKISDEVELSEIVDGNE